MAEVVNTAQQKKVAYSPADFAFVTVRDPEFYRDRSALLLGAKGQGKGGSLPGITDRTAPQSSYSLITYARTGVYGPGLDAIQNGGGTGQLPQGLYLFSSTNPLSTGITAVGAQSVGGLGGMTGADKWYVLRMVPVPPQGPQEGTGSEGQTAPALLAPRPHALVRGSAQTTLTISEWMIDNELSAMPGTNVTPGGAWLEAYIAAWQTLATPHPVLGRKPALALKFGNRFWGLGQTVVYLDDVQVTRNWYDRGVLANATLGLRFSEVSR